MNIQENPYASPLAGPLRGSPPVTASELARPGLRFLNLILDQILMIPYFFVLVSLLGFFVGDEVARWVAAVPDFLFGIIMMFLYYVPLETLLGKTPAKFITGTRVVSLDGSPAGILPVLLRTVCRLIPFEAISFLNPEQPVGLHDRLSKTRVIKNLD